MMECVGQDADTSVLMVDGVSEEVSHETQA
jgi:hypothetical protein